MAVRRLNWGCGPHPVAGWINADLLTGPGIEISRDIRAGLPLESATIDYITSIHALQDLPYREVVPALQELYRVLRPGGTLRLALPDLERGVAAYVRNDADYFVVPDTEVLTISGKLIVQMTWYGASRMMFTYEFAEELLLRAGYDHVSRCAFQQTLSAFPAIVELDNRERETLFIEATK